ncbi:MAG TPA: hypothetical protein P5274_00120 [Candidatus Paceibacterota bacterium]|nr:hypothetical protein [Candidatus Paceibacterota bacterium]
MSQIKTNKFLEIALEQIPRLLGQLNRNPSSISYGSFDRAFWHYRTNDISCVRYQEATLTLALLYCHNFEGNNYYQDKKVFEWIRASLLFTVRLQRRNGSFDEWYINEGSYVATAFQVVALSQAIILFREKGVVLPEEAVVLTCLEKAIQFLIKNKEETVMNQVSGAILAIASVGYLCQRKDLIIFADNLLDDFITKQNFEGWWSEYGGPDIGYLTLTINYLEKYQTLTGSQKVTPVISKAKDFVLAFINPDLTAGGEYMSRNTEYIIPSAALPYLGALKPLHLDDRYLCYILYNWIEAGLKILPQDFELHKGNNFYRNSRLLRVASESYFLVVNGDKGGSFRLYSNGKVYYDSGLEISSRLGRFSTGILDKNNKVLFGHGEFLASGSVKVIREPLMKTLTTIVFKFWQFFLGRVSFFQKLVKDFLRPRMINYSSRSSLTFERKFKYSKDEIIVTDIIYGGAKNDIKFGVKASYSAVPSSKYAAVPENDSLRLHPDFEEKEENELYLIKRIFHFGI